MTVRSILAALVAMILPAFVPVAEARIDSGPVLSDYGVTEGSLVKPNLAKNFRGPGSNRYSKSAGKGSKRATGVARATGGGTSRSCLTSAARGLLDRIESRFGPVRVVSTCRPGAVIATSGKPSKHRSGNAIDFDAGSRKGAIVSWLAANHTSGGTMTYRDMSHIHVDIGYRFVKLGARSGHG